MATDIAHFRGSVFGGFNRQDVAEYIRQVSEERDRESARADALQSRLQELSAALEEARQENASLTGELSQVRSEMSENEDSFLHIIEETRSAYDGAIHQRDDELAQARNLAEELKAQHRAETESLRTFYFEELARRDATKKGSWDTLRQELRSVVTLVSGIAADTASDTETLRLHMEELLSGLSTTAGAAEEAKRLLTDIEKALDENGDTEELPMAPFPIGVADDGDTAQEAPVVLSADSGEADTEDQG